MRALNSWITCSFFFLLVRFRKKVLLVKQRVFLALNLYKVCCFQNCASTNIHNTSFPKCCSSDLCTFSANSAFTTPNLSTQAPVLSTQTSSKPAQQVTPLVTTGTTTQSITIPITSTNPTQSNTQPPVSSSIGYYVCHYQYNPCFQLKPPCFTLHLAKLHAPYCTTYLVNVLRSVKTCKVPVPTLEQSEFELKLFFNY